MLGCWEVRGGSVIDGWGDRVSILGGSPAPCPLSGGHTLFVGRVNGVRGAGAQAGVPRGAMHGAGGAGTFTLGDFALSELGICKREERRRATG